MPKRTKIQTNGKPASITMIRVNKDCDGISRPALYTVLSLLIVFLSVSLFFARNPNGVCKENKKEFKTAELLVAIFFPTFYILYVVLQDGDKECNKKENYEKEDTKHKTLHIVRNIVIVIAMLLLCISLIMWYKRTSKMNSTEAPIWKWDDTYTFNIKELLFAIFGFPIYIIYAAVKNRQTRQAYDD